MLEVKVKSANFLRLTIVGENGLDPSHVIAINPEYIVCLEQWFSSVPNTQVGYGHKPMRAENGAQVTLSTGRVLRTREAVSDIEDSLEDMGIS